MRWSFDADSASIYLYLAEGVPASQVELADGSVVDLDEEGRLVGLEVVNADSTWQPGLLYDRFDVDDGTRASLDFVASGLSFAIARRLHANGDHGAVGTDSPAQVLVPA